MEEAPTNARVVTVRMNEAEDVMRDAVRDLCEQRGKRLIDVRCYAIITERDET